MKILSLKAISVLALITFVMSFVAMAPASFAVKQLQKANNGDLQFSNTSGSLWVGQVRAEIPQRGMHADIKWDLQLLKLLLLKVSAELDISTNLGNFQGRASRGLNSIQVDNLQGKVSARAVSDLLSSMNVLAVFYTDIEFEDVQVTWNDGEFAAAKGKLSWQGGDISVNKKDITMPPLLGQIDLEEQGLMLQVAAADEPDILLADAGVSHSGEGSLRVREAITAYVSIPDNLKVGDLSSVMFEVKQNVFNSPNQ